MNDFSFHNYLYAGFGYGMGYLFENAIYLELRRRGYDVYVGELDGYEVDFVAIKNDARIYIQVAYKMDGESTIAREYAPLERIRDSYPKYVVSLDEFKLPSNNGILHVRPWEIR
jgi:predicted AAA+ superfamily ATPase